MTSKAATRPPPSLGRRRWQTIQRTVSESRIRIWVSSSEGNIPMTRLIVCPASTVWRVLRTRCPVSAADRAISTVSRSRISPTRITFGAWRSAARSPFAKVSKSFPISRWLKVAFLWEWENSTGSSSVTMWTALCSLISFRSAASDVDLPLPVAPVTRMIPFFSSAILWKASGRFMSWKVGIRVSSFLRTME